MHPQIDSFRIADDSGVNKQISTGGYYHGSGLPSRKNPSVGPLSGRVAAHKIPAAPSRTERGAPAPPISVATQPGHTEFTRIREPRSSPASVRVKAFSAALVTCYAGGPAPMFVSDPDSEETLTIRPVRLFRMRGRNAWQTRHGPNKFVVIASITVPLISAFATASQVS
jgi:hypothetical protein